MKSIFFSIPGRPIPKGRPRAARVGKFVKMYTPSTTASYENLVKVYYGMASKLDPLTGALRVVIDCYFPVPASLSMKKTNAILENKTKYVKMPDVDNVGKCILDALNSFAFVDDKQVYHLTVAKWFSAKPRADVTIYYDEEEE